MTKRNTILQRYFQYQVGQTVMANISKVQDGILIEQGTLFTIDAFPLKTGPEWFVDYDDKGNQYRRFVIGHTQLGHTISLLMTQVVAPEVTTPTIIMKMTIPCCDQHILVEWQGRLKAGTIVRVHTGDPGLAMNIIPLLLDQKHKRNLWYQSGWVGNTHVQDMVLCKGTKENWDNWNRDDVIARPKHPTKR